MKKINFLISLILISSIAYGQQIGMYNHYFYKPMVYNPAFTGTSDATNIMVISRSQWTDFKGAPQLNIVTVDGNLMNKKVGLGVELISDKKGLLNRTGGDFSYSYNLKINDDMHLLFGVSLGIIEQTIDYSKAMVETSTDPTLFTNAQSKTIFDVNAGLAFFWKGLEFGAAVPQLIGNKINYVDNTNVRSDYVQVRHYMGSLKYKFPISKAKNVFIIPQGLVRYVPNIPFQYDATINLDWQDKFWMGTAYKNDYAVSANAGFYIHKQLCIGYSYDFIIGNIGKYSGMSHEIMINFKFGKSKKEETIVEKPQDNRANDASAKQVDSLEIQVKDLQSKLNKLSIELDQVHGQIGNTLPDNENQNARKDQNSSNKKYENGVLIITSLTNEFKDVNDKTPPPKGFYVVAGTFYPESYKTEKQPEIKKGSELTNWVYSGPLNLNYIFMFRLKTLDEALEKIKIAKEAGVKDPWIQELIEK